MSENSTAEVRKADKPKKTKPPKPGIQCDGCRAIDNCPPSRMAEIYELERLDPNINCDHLTG